jgi:hypothetical protein
MTTSYSRKCGRRARCRSNSLDRARPDTRHRPQIIRQLVMFETIRRSSVSRSAVEELVASARFKPASSPAALKSP